MVYSDEFIRLLRKKAVREEILIEIVRILLFDFLKEVPLDLRWDIFSMFHPDYEDEAKISLDDAEHLSVVIDLFEGEYEEDKLNLSDDEVKFISEGVNDFALELSDDALMNVMRAAVSRGLLG